METKKNILVVVTNYIDDSIISARRWRYLSEYLAEHGYNITVVSHDGKNQDSELCINDINIMAMMGNAVKDINHANMTENLKKYKDILWPLLAVYYRITEIKMKVDLKRRIQYLYTKGVLQKLKNIHFDMIISSVYNVDAFIIAKELRRILGIKKHICDIRDPLVNPFFGNKAQHWQGIRLTKEIHQEVDALLTVEELIKNEIYSVVKRGKKPVYVVPHAYRIYLSNSNPKSEVNGKEGGKASEAGLRLALVGTYYPENHNAMPIVYAIKELEKKKEINKGTVKITVAGRNSSFFKKCFTDNGVGAYVEDRKFVPYDEAIEIQKQADILLFLSSIDEVSEYQGVTGKFAEYLSLNKELLMMFDVRNHAEKQMDYFRKMRIGLTVSTKDSNAVKLIEEWIKVKITEKSKGAVLHDPDMEIVNGYSLSHVGGQVEKILQKTLG